MNLSKLSGQLRDFVNKYPQLAKPTKGLLRRYMGRFFPASAIDVERAEWRFYLDYVQEGMVVFDVGANLGELTRFFSHFVGNKGAVHAFEASSQTFEKLKSTCVLKDHENIVLNHLAVAEEIKTVKFHVYPQEYWGLNSIADRPLQNYGMDVIPARVEEVQTTTIDDYCQRNGIGHIDLLKIDVEGAEYQVLQGARQMLSQQKISCGLFEFGQSTFDMGNDPNALEAFLNENGYRVRNLIPNNPKFPKDHNQLGQFSMHLMLPIKSR